MAAWVAKRASSEPSVASRILLGKKLISSTPFLGAPLIVHTIACSAERGYHDGCVPVHEARNARRRRWVHGHHGVHRRSGWLRQRPGLHFSSAHHQHRATRATVDSLRKARGEKRSEPTNLPTTNDDQANLNLLGGPGDVLFRRLSLLRTPQFPSTSLAHARSIRGKLR